MNYKYILAIDPSGAYHEGKGTTGWCILKRNKQPKIIETGAIFASQYNSAPQYWDAHIKLIEYVKQLSKGNFIVVIEDYILYSNKAQSQSNSHMETCRLLGILEHYCAMNQIPYHFQLATFVVNRWSNDVLEFKGLIVKQGIGYRLPQKTFKLNRHMLDAIRHGVHFFTFGNGE